jgi:CheY-like chemotaxis protein
LKKEARKLCILLVDDDQIANLIHKRTMESPPLNACVVARTDGRDALSYLTGTRDADYARPDLIFLDIRMPHMDGWEFLDLYRNLPSSQKADGVVLMTAVNSDPADRTKAGQYPEVRALISKTLTLEKIQSVLDRAG